MNKVQWVDFKLENVLVSLHFLKTMGLGPFGASAPLFLRNGELLGHSPIHNALACGSGIINISTLHSLKIMESFDNRFTSQVDFNSVEVKFRCK
jgi:hypothetical protein